MAESSLTMSIHTTVTDISQVFRTLILLFPSGGRCLQSTTGKEKKEKELEDSELEFGTQCPAPDLLLTSFKPDAHTQCCCKSFFRFLRRERDIWERLNFGGREKTFMETEYLFTCCLMADNNTFCQENQALVYTIL